MADRDKSGDRPLRLMALAQRRKGGPVPALQQPSIDPEDGPPSARFNRTHIQAVLDHQGRNATWLARRMGYHRTHVARVIKGEKKITEQFIALACVALDLPEDILFDHDGAH